MVNLKMLWDKTLLVFVLIILLNIKVEAIKKLKKRNIDCDSIEGRQQGLLKTPGYPDRLPTSHIRCTWKLIGNWTKQVNVTFVKVSLPGNASCTNATSFVAYGVYFANGSAEEKGRLCGIHKHKFSWQPPYKWVWIEVTSHGFSRSNPAMPFNYKGVLIEYSYQLTPFEKKVQTVVDIAVAVVIALSLLLIPLSQAIRKEKQNDQLAKKRETEERNLLKKYRKLYGNWKPPQKKGPNSDDSLRKRLLKRSLEEQMSVSPVGSMCRHRSKRRRKIEDSEQKRKSEVHVLALQAAALDQQLEVDNQAEPAAGSSSFAEAARRSFRGLHKAIKNYGAQTSSLSKQWWSKIVLHQGSSSQEDLLPDTQVTTEAVIEHVHSSSTSLDELADELIKDKSIDSSPDEDEDEVRSNIYEQIDKDDEDNVPLDNTNEALDESSQHESVDVSPVSLQIKPDLARFQWDADGEATPDIFPMWKLSEPSVVPGPDTNCADERDPNTSHAENIEKKLGDPSSRLKMLPSGGTCTNNDLEEFSRNEVLDICDDDKNDQEVSKPSDATTFIETNLDDVIDLSDSPSYLSGIDALPMHEDPRNQNGELFNNTDINDSIYKRTSFATVRSRAQLRLDNKFVQHNACSDTIRNERFDFSTPYVPFVKDKHHWKYDEKVYDDVFELESVDKRNQNADTSIGQQYVKGRRELRASSGASYLSGRNPNESSLLSVSMHSHLKKSPIFKMVQRIKDSVISHKIKRCAPTSDTNLDDLPKTVIYPESYLSSQATPAEAKKPPPVDKLNIEDLNRQEFYGKNSDIGYLVCERSIDSPSELGVSGGSSRASSIDSFNSEIQTVVQNKCDSIEEDMASDEDNEWEDTTIAATRERAQRRSTTPLSFRSSTPPTLAAIAEVSEPSTSDHGSDEVQLPPTNDPHNAGDIFDITAPEVPHLFKTEVSTFEENSFRRKSDPLSIHNLHNTAEKYKQRRMFMSPVSPVSLGSFTMTISSQESSKSISTAPFNRSLAQRSLPSITSIPSSSDRDSSFTSITPLAYDVKENFSPYDTKEKCSPRQIRPSPLARSRRESSAEKSLLEPVESDIDNTHKTGYSINSSNASKFRVENNLSSSLYPRTRHSDTPDDLLDPYISPSDEDISQKKTTNYLAATPSRNTMPYALFHHRQLNESEKTDRTNDTSLHNLIAAEDSAHTWRVANFSDLVDRTPLTPQQDRARCAAISTRLDDQFEAMGDINSYQDESSNLKDTKNEGMAEYYSSYEGKSPLAVRDPYSSGEHPLDRINVRSLPSGFHLHHPSSHTKPPGQKHTMESPRYTSRTPNQRRGREFDGRSSMQYTGPGQKHVSQEDDSTPNARAHYSSPSRPSMVDFSDAEHTLGEVSGEAAISREPSQVDFHSPPNTPPQRRTNGVKGYFV